MSLFKPPGGYELMAEGRIKTGDLFWSYNATDWLPAFPENVGRQIDDSILIAREIKTGYFSFVDGGEGEYESIDFYEEKPEHDAIEALADDFSNRVILMEGRIIDEAEPPGEA